MALTDRRRVLRGGAGAAAVLGLGACATTTPASRALGGAPRVLGGFTFLPPVRAQADRLFDVTVCLRPFRAAGPRLDTEEVGDTLVVHNYGHGGSGWSLSWGSSTLAVEKAMSRSPSRIAVIGCGALGLTSAILAQAAGAQVTIYARDLLPETRSARATGSWTPDSRIALADAVAPDFPAVWERMARTSFKTYRRYLGLPGAPVEWTDRYLASDLSPEEIRRRRTPGRLSFAEYADRIADLTPAYEELSRGSTSLATAYVRRSSAMMFNIADYGHTLMSDFRVAGGVIRRMEFRAPADLTRLPEKVVIDCPGYGARTLWNDASIVPVRGQIGWLIPQPEVGYGVVYKDVSMLSRRDGIVIQALEGGDMKGYGDDDETPNRSESGTAVAKIAELYARSRAAAPSPA